MYEHYERNRTDNITDPAVRRERPISTISGWDRERGADEKVDEASGEVAGTAPKAIVEAAHSNGQADTPEREQANKSEQTEDANAAAEPDKCVCDTDENSNTASDAGTDKTKPLSSISNISQVYNEQLSGQSTSTTACNGEVPRAEDEEAEGAAAMTAAAEEQPNESANTSGSDALRKTLEIDAYDVNDEESKEIVDEIVMEILAKSEIALDDCKRTLDESHLTQPETTSPVLKDEELEHAVNEVVKGVRNIEIMCRKEADKSDEMDVSLNETTATGDDNDDDGELPTPTESDDNQKTDAANDTDNFGDDIDENAGVALEPRPVPATLNTTEEIKEIVSTIVNDVIENCVNQTNKTITNDVCDNETNTQPINQDDINDDSINNNSSDSTMLETTTSDNNDNAIITESSVPAIESVHDTIGVETKTETVTADATMATTPAVEETNEDIVRGIVDEIVDKCVEQEMNTANSANNNNNAGDGVGSVDDNSNSAENSATLNQIPTEIQSTECTTSDATSTQNNSNNNSAGDNESIDNRGIEQNRTQSKSISTSTQVENNHFGNELSERTLNTLKLLIRFFVFFSSFFFEHFDSLGEFIIFFIVFPSNFV